MDSKKIEEVSKSKEELHELRQTLGSLRDKKLVIEGKIREVNNWLAGHQWTQDELAARGLLGTVSDKRSELERLNKGLAEIRGDMENCTTRIDLLEKLTYSTSDEIGYALMQLNARIADLQGLKDKEAGLKNELDTAKKDVASAESARFSAQREKEKGLSLNAVSAANKSEANASKRIEEINHLIGNLNRSIASIPQGILVAKADVQRAEEMLWRAHAVAFVEQVRASDFYVQASGVLQDGFIAWVSGGMGFDFGAFLVKVFAKDGESHKDLEKVKTRKSELAHGLGVPNID